MLSVLWNYFRVLLFGFCLRMVVLSRSQLRSFWNWLCVHVCIISVQLRKASNLRLNQWFQHPKTCLCDNCDNGIYADADEHVMIRILWLLWWLWLGFLRFCGWHGCERCESSFAFFRRKSALWRALVSWENITARGSSLLPVCMIIVNYSAECCVAVHCQCNCNEAS